MVGLQFLVPISKPAWLPCGGVRSVGHTSAVNELATAKQHPISPQHELTVVSNHASGRRYRSRPISIWDRREANTAKVALGFVKKIQSIVSDRT
jgi:hypothetical protein